MNNQNVQTTIVHEGVKSHTRDEITAWLANALADLLEIKPSEISVTTSFPRYGLDSSAAIGLTDSLGEWLGRELEPTLLYDYPNIESLANHLAD